MKGTLLQIAGALALMVSAVFVVLVTLGHGEHRLLKWVPVLVVVASLAILIPMLSARDKGRMD